MSQVNQILESLKLADDKKIKVEEFVTSLKTLFSDSMSAPEKLEVESNIGSALATWGCTATLGKGKTKQASVDNALRMLALVRAKTE